MSSTIVTPTVDPNRTKGKGVAPQWDETKMRERTRLLIIAMVSVTGVIWIGLFVWVFFIAPIFPTTSVIAPPVGTDLLVILAPVIAAATAVERLLESAFNTLENVWRTGVAYIGYGMRWLKRAETEVADARQWMQNIGLVYNNLQAKYVTEMNQLMAQPALEHIATQLADLKRKADQETANVQIMLAEAEARVAQAEDKLTQAGSSPDYRNAKAAASVVLGLMLGVFVATFGQIKMFALLGIAMPARIDVFATGIVIGSGSYPVHSLVGILQQGRDALDGLGNFLNNRSSPAQRPVTEGELPPELPAAVPTPAAPSAGTTMAG